MRAIANPPLSFCGETVSKEDLSLIRQVIERYPSLSRTELANTLCELLDWNRSNGGLKTVECRQFLEGLEARSLIELPQRRLGRPRGSKTRADRTARGAAANR